MKLPRWLVVTLLSASLVAMLAYGAWWWVTWPERTMNRFVEAARASDVNEWRRLQSDSLKAADRVQEQDTPWVPTIAGAVPRSWMDVICARQLFNVEARDVALRYQVT